MTCGLPYSDFVNATMTTCAIAGLALAAGVTLAQFIGFGVYLWKGWRS